MKRVLLSLLIAALPALSAAQSLPVDDARLRTALQAAESGAADFGLAADHPLWPWYQQASLRKRIDQLGTEEANRFLQAHAGQPAGEAFRDAWLSQLAKRGDWSTFLANWQPREDMGLRCAHLQAQAATGKAGADWNPRAQAIWSGAGKSLPDRCDAVIDALSARGAMTDALRWQRVDAAVSEGQSAIMRRAARGLPADQLALATDYAAFLDAAHDRAAQWPVTERSRAVATAGLAALAKRDPEAAEARLPALARALQLSDAQQGQVRYQIALWTVASYLPRSAERLAAVPAAAWDERLHEWQVREALSRSDWQAALAALRRMPDTQRNDARWQWFTARMLEKTGKTGEANALLAKVASSPTFHGFLAADRLRQPYALCPVELDTRSKLRNEVANTPALQRALMLQRLDRIGWAGREWNSALSGFNDEQRQHAVALAVDAGWFDRAVAALKSEKELRMYRLRFPFHHEETLRRQAAANGLDPAWVAAEIRAESTFNPNARSPANALGLMQVIPSTGQAVAKRIGLTDYAGERSLFDPDTNITIGTAYLRELKEKYGNKPYVVLAAYNAGPTPTGRWLSQRGDFDPDIWIETISYKETRDYVARVLAFSVIYDWRLNGKAVSLADRMEGRLGQPSRTFHCPQQTAP